MNEVLSSVMRKARKDHKDSAGVWIQNSLSGIRGLGIGKGKYDLTFSEWRTIARLKANNWKILKGQMYQDNSMKQDGELYTFRCIPEVNEICLKLDMYADC